MTGLAVTLLIVLAGLAIFAWWFFRMAADVEEAREVWLPESDPRRRPNWRRI